MVQVDPIQSYLNLKIGLPTVLKAGSSGIYLNFKSETKCEKPKTKKLKSNHFY
jgi:hypothetical protein